MCLVCPVCGGDLIKGEKSYVCPANHTYDIARAGYVNLLTPGGKHTPEPGDNKEMIAARTAVMDKGYYKTVFGCLKEILDGERRPFILDAGCGEGSITRFLKDFLKEAYVIGMDISKNAVAAAGKKSKGIEYIAASCKKIPVKSSSVDYIINAFAPANYPEFLRVLKPSGKLIKITPGEKHLFSLKAMLYDNPYLNPSDNEIPDGFTLLDEYKAESQFTVEGGDIENLIKMTPYYYKTDPGRLNEVFSLPSLTTGLCFSVRVFKKK